MTLDPAVTSINASAEQLCDDLRQRRQDAINSIAKAQKIQKKYVDLKRSDREFEEGELAVLKFSRKQLGYKPPKEHSSKLGLLGRPLPNIKSFQRSRIKSHCLQDQIFTMLCQLRIYANSDRRYQTTTYYF